MNTDPTDSLGNALLDQLAEEFTERLRRGERPAIAEYEQAHPDLAEQIREMFQTIVRVEQLGPYAEDLLAERDLDGAPPTGLPQRLGEYQIIRRIGQGGMGTVYKARHTKLKRDVAVKALPQNLAADARSIARFEREMEAVGRVDHPNIVRAMGEGHASTWRMMLIKVAARIQVQVRRVRVFLSGSWPFLPCFRQIGEALVAGP